MEQSHTKAAAMPSRWLSMRWSTFGLSGMVVSSRTQGSGITRRRLAYSSRAPIRYIGVKDGGRACGNAPVVRPLYPTRTFVPIRLILVVLQRFSRVHHSDQVTAEDGAV